MKRTSWAFDSGPEGSTKDNVTEQRMYLVNEQPVKCLEKKYTIRSAAASNPKPEEVANKPTACNSAPSELKKYKILFKYNKGKQPACMEID
ncbi:MAG: hypothetical protein EOO89_25835 [Pedobacter sp.]|nr:MAG: hypothetical protein EOO89_25835 [Pedobacter sp.]